MPPVNGSYLAATRVEYRMGFQRAFDAISPDYALFVDEQTTTSGGKTTVFWPGAPPMMREWLGDAVLDAMDLYKWEIEHKKWQAGFKIKREDIVDDELGWVRPHIATLATEARQHPGRLVFDMINNADTLLAYDGQYFFDTDHQDGSGPVQSNKITGVISETSLQLMRTTMGRWKDHKSRPMPMRLTHILVPPELELVAKKLIEQEYLASGETNVNRGSVTVVVNPYLTSPLKWYGFDLSKGIKPFVLRWRERPELVAQEAANDEEAFMRQVFRYNVWGRYGVGLGPWQFAIMSTGAP